MRKHTSTLIAGAVWTVGVALALTLPAAAAAAPYVVIDAGHGGSAYSGAVGNGVVESQVNLLIAQELAGQLQAAGYRVGMTRTRDTQVRYDDAPTWHWLSDGLPHFYADGSFTLSDDLQARCDVANATGADLFVSVHNNDYDDSGANGTETYASADDPLGQRLAATVQEQVVSEVGVVDRGDKQAGFYVMRWANMPAILVEGGFVSNAADATRLKDPAWRLRFARAVAHGIVRFLDTDPFQPVYPRLAGADRYGTAAAVSRAGWPSGASKVILASGANWPDALAASPLSRKLDAPLLLSKPGTLPPATAAELARLRPSEVVVLGSESAVASSVASAAATAAGAPVRRIGGADRYETAALIAAEVGLPAEGRVALASGRTFADALSLSPYLGRAGIPLLLTQGAELSTAAASFIARHAADVHAVVVAGSEAAVPASAVSRLPGVTRLAGADRWGTNVAVLEAWGTSAVTPLVAIGTDFPDGLVAGAYGAKSGRPVMLVNRRILPDVTREFMEQNTSRVAGFTISGSERAIPYLMDRELEKAGY